MIQEKPHKLAVVCAAGGMSCSYSGGALVALAKEHDILQPDYMIAASGSAGSAMYYLAGQYESIRRIWTGHVCSPRFLSLKRPLKMMDVDYLVDTIIREMEPLDLEKLANLQTLYFIPVKNAATGAGRYISCREGHDVHEILRATKALPFFYGRKVRIGGESYIDSALKITKEHGVAKAIDLGATHVLVLETHNRIETRVRTLVRMASSRFVRKKPDVIGEAPGVRILRLGPDKNPAPPLTRNPDRLSAAYQKGYQDVRDNLELRGFLQTFLARPE